ncbi:hypothetical protein EZJ19_10410 [Parasulfuritortus cantonensis]|uniref:Uncharacterized protein n=1 Tax=Parasulfuritortus cantonensis TaxID=2528202 RepID=A0A4R1B5M9_9PROT|nr:hypothetical protein [Parasulfuritortus cantonensis]TCJ13454.1 hypothetical protein EZJ19_10410 [Parasulfuritortus cantonensis]
MSVPAIPDYTEAELRLVDAALKERYGQAVDFQEVETEVRLTPADRELTACPAVYWEDADSCRFVVAKTGVDKFRSMFFWSVKDRFATGKEEYDNLGDCLVTTLKMQEEAAHRRAEEVGQQ